MNTMQISPIKSWNSEQLIRYGKRNTTLLEVKMGRMLQNNSNVRNRVQLQNLLDLLINLNYKNLDSLLLTF